MSFTRNGAFRTRGGREGSGVTDLAFRALGLLATRRKAELGDVWADALRNAVTSRDPMARSQVVSDMLAAGIGRERICDHYVPLVARRLGEEWCDDTTSFADVTIGSARLQSLLRDVALRDEPGATAGAEDRLVLVIADEYHTLGAMVLTGQLRRLGASVRLLLGRPSREVRQIVGGTEFDAIMLSVALADDFATVRRMIETLRNLTNGQVPLIVGGSIMELGEVAAQDVTGADHVTGDPRMALRLTGHGGTASQRD